MTTRTPVRFVGDIHGRVSELQALTQGHPETFLVLGDVGFGFSPIPDFENVWFLRGNHDDPLKARSHPQYLGEYGTWDDIFFCGGAFSIDFAWRQAMMRAGHAPCWWPDEELSEEVLGKAVGAYAAAAPDIVATHEAPASVGVLLLKELSIRPGKLGCAMSRTARALQRMLDIHRPEHWYFGHYHIDWEREIDGTVFHCLNELSVMPCPSGTPSNPAERKEH